MMAAARVNRRVFLQLSVLGLMGAGTAGLVLRRPKPADAIDRLCRGPQGCDGCEQFADCTLPQRRADRPGEVAHG